MVTDPREYDKFGRSTKLLIHPKDIQNVQFDRQQTIRARSRQRQKTQ